MTQRWTIADKTTGEVLCACFETPSLGVHPKDRGWRWDADTQKATRIDAVPTLQQRWNGSAWVTDLDICRAERWSLVKDARNAAEVGGCTTALGRVDTDADSQRKVSGSVQLAMIAQAAGVPFAIDWTMHDNSTVEHDSAAMIAMGVAVGWHIAACHSVALAKRTALDAATTEEQLRAVEVETGWPS